MRASTAELLRLAQLARGRLRLSSADQIERRADLICAQLADECAEENVDIAALIAPPSSAGSGGRPSARALVRWLTAASRSSAGARRLRLALYCRLPMLGPPSGESGEQRILQPGDAVLAYGHRVLAGIGSQCESTQAVSATACRILAARHPRLLPPILPVAAALLSGRYLLPWTEFRWQGPLAMFGCLVQVLEHLGPRLYQSDTTRPAVDAILSSYARALHRYRDNARVALIPLGAKLALLLCAYVSAAPRPARRLLASLRPQLTSLPSDLTDSLPELTALTASGDIDDESIDSRLDSDADYQDDVLDFGAAPASDAASAGRHSWSHSLIANCRKRLRQLDNLADLTDALRELEDKTRRRPDLLDSFVGDIERLIGDACPEVRGPALTLLLRQARRGGSDVDSSEHAAAAAAVLRHLQPGADPGARAQLLACLPELASVWPDRSPALLAAVARLAAAGVPDAAKAYGAALDQLNLEALLPGAAAAADSDAAGSDNQQQQQQSGALATADDAPSTSDRQTPAVGWDHRGWGFNSYAEGDSASKATAAAAANSFGLSHYIKSLEAMEPGGSGGGPMEAFIEARGTVASKVQAASTGQSETTQKTTWTKTKEEEEEDDDEVAQPADSELADEATSSAPPAATAMELELDELTAERTAGQLGDQAAVTPESAGEISFLVTLLDDPGSGGCICWTGKEMEFKLIEPEEAAGSQTGWS
uniref:ETS domain-containing protein n=1 Tax=Macrostomum lignano TaxID=282301 RepID=A0A1I8J8M7_9PLAT